jgi:cytochrome c biogenesis protein CcmG/thiol:disulfide interchange protein DsbE
MHHQFSSFHQFSIAARFFLFAGLTFAASLVFLACESKSVLTDATTNIKPGQPTPAASNPQIKVEQVSDFDIQMMDGSMAKLSALQNEHKVLVINFWATWCGPCKQEIPHMVELQDQYKDKGVEVVGLTVEDPKDDLLKVRNFYKVMNINYRVGFSSDKMFNTFNGNDPGGAIPQTFIFDRKGNMVKHIRGFSPKIASTLKEGIEQALRQA